MTTKTFNGQEFEIECAGEFAVREPELMKQLVHENQFQKLCKQYGVNPEKCRANWNHWLAGGNSPLPGQYVTKIVD